MFHNWAGSPDHKEKGQAVYDRFRDVDTGLLPGALILTLDGEIPVEQARIGDSLITRDSGVAKITHVQTVTRPCHVIRVPTFTFGVGAPGAQSLLAADQMILLRGTTARAYLDCATALVTARGLCAEEGVKDLGQQDTTLHQIFCAAPHILYCDGLELSTADGARARGKALDAA